MHSKAKTWASRTPPESLGGGGSRFDTLSSPVALGPLPPRLSPQKTKTPTPPKVLSMVTLERCSRGGPGQTADCWGAPRGYHQPVASPPLPTPSFTWPSAPSPGRLAEWPLAASATSRPPPPTQRRNRLPVQQVRRFLRRIERYQWCFPKDLRQVRILSPPLVLSLAEP